MNMCFANGPSATRPARPLVDQSGQKSPLTCTAHKYVARAPKADFDVPFRNKARTRRMAMAKVAGSPLDPEPLR